MLVEIGQLVEVAGEDQACGEIVGAGEGGHQHQAFARHPDQRTDPPGRVPEGQEVEQHEDGEQGTEPADPQGRAALQPFLDASGKAAQHLGDREAEHQAVEREQEFEIVHRGSACGGCRGLTRGQPLPHEP